MTNPRFIGAILKQQKRHYELKKTTYSFAASERDACSTSDPIKAILARAAEFALVCDN